MEQKLFEIEITRGQIRAAMLFAAQKDIRYYLNGICLEVDQAGDARVVATDGHRLCMTHLGTAPQGTQAGQWIIPRELLAGIKKPGRGESDKLILAIHSGDEPTQPGRYSLTHWQDGSTLASAKLIDGKFPDWQRVIPANTSGEAGTYNPDYLADIARAGRELKSKTLYNFSQNGNNAGFSAFPDVKFCAGVMPMRHDEINPADMEWLHPRRVFRAVVEYADPVKNGHFPRDPDQDTSDKLGKQVEASGEEIAQPVPEDATTSGEDTDNPAKPFDNARFHSDMVDALKTAGWTHDPARERIECGRFFVFDRNNILGKCGNEWAEWRIFLNKYTEGVAASGFITAGVLSAQEKTAQQTADDITHAVAKLESLRLKKTTQATHPGRTLIEGRHIPFGTENASRLACDPLTGGEVWRIRASNPKNACAVIAYGGKRLKPDAYYAMRSEEDAQRWANEYLQKLSDRAASKKQDDNEKKAKRAAGHLLKPGDVLMSSWGYDQTNIDYYQVTRLIGARMVEIREIGQQVAHTGDMSGNCVPAPGHFVGAPMRKVVSDGGQSVKVRSFAWATLVKPKEVAGMKIYPMDHWTAYA